MAGHGPPCAALARTTDEEAVAILSKVLKVEKGELAEAAAAALTATGRPEKRR